MTDTHDKAIIPQEVGVTAGDDTIHPIVQAIIKGMVDPDQIDALEKFSELQIRHEDRMAEQAFNRDMIALKADLPSSLDRDQEVDFTNTKGIRTHYWHTSLANAVDTVVEIMGNHGFSHRWRTTNTDRAVTVTCILSHSSPNLQVGHREETTLTAPPDAKGGKSAPQAIASTTTLLQRYTLFAALGLASKDMKDPDDHKSLAGDARADSLDIDTMLNSMQRVGVSREEIEESLQKPIEEITDRDLKELRMWYRDRRAERDDA